MQLITRITQRIKRDLFRWMHASVAKKILTTAPLEKGNVPFLVLSMVHKRDVISYLVAIKSFAHFLNPSRIVVVCDPSIDERDRAIIKQQIPHMEFRHADEFTHADIPRGGVWERLFAITEYARENYVIQLDADTLTTSAIPEVRDAILQRIGFVLGECSTTGLDTLTEARERALPWLAPDAHVQCLAEIEMVNVGLPASARYIRGCAGFTGFPVSQSMRADMLDFSRRMTASLGKHWARWGTDQVTSNYLVANAAGTRALPFPKYGTPDEATADTAFFHFIGSMRFINGKYAATTQQAIQMLTPPSKL